MALGANQLVPLGPLGILGIIAHFSAVKHGQYIRNAQRAADMARADGMDGFNGGYANLAGKGFQFSVLVHFMLPSLSVFCSRPFHAPFSGMAEPWRSARTTGSSSPLKKRISAPPPVQI